MPIASPLRLVFIIPCGIERPSGVRWFNIARALVRRGHRVRVLALHPDLAHCPQRRFVQDGVEVWYCGQMHVRKGAGGPQRFGPLQLLWVLLSATIGLLWGVLRSPADAYHLGKPQPVNGLAGLLGVRWLRRAPLYLDCDDDETTSNRFTASWQRAVFQFWQWLVPRFVLGATANTHYLAARLLAADVQPVVYVPNGVDPARFALPPQRRLAGLRAGLGLDGTRVIAYVGSLALQNHPVDLLLTAFAQLSVTRPDLRLLVVGDGEDLAALKAQAAQLGVAGQTLFLGAVTQQTVPALLGLADVSADPVRADPVAQARSPLKLFESLALGVPVVTADVGDRRALLADGACGALVAPDDPAALALGLAALLDDPAARAAAASAALRHVQRYYWDALAAIWETVYATA